LDESLERLKAGAVKTLDEMMEAGNLVKPAHDFFVIAVGQLDSAIDVMEYKKELANMSTVEVVRWAYKFVVEGTEETSQ
jgi:hypothetical protein